MLKALRCGVTIVSSISLPLGAVPAYAADDTTKTGIAAGLGLSAASGKTTLGDGAGAIEASLLDSDSMLQAGRAVRQIADSARTQYNNRKVLILDKDDQIDFSMALWVVKRMEDLNLAAGRLQIADCKNKPIIVATRTVTTGPKKNSAGTGRMKSQSTGGSESSTTSTTFGFARTDIVAALATDVSVGGVKLGVDDRTLIDAILMGNSRAAWLNAKNATFTFAKASNDGFGLLNEQQAVDPGSNHAFEELRKLQTWTDINRKCDSDSFKAMLNTIDQFVSSITASDKGTPAIVTAAELAPDGFNKLPLILRVAIDDRGGTTVTRSSIWYSLGWPGAAVITSGLKVSFKLSDPRDGTNLTTGQVRCVTRPISYRDVSKMLITIDASGDEMLREQQEKLVTCAYRLSA
jgi:hypothetical protein